MKKEFIRLSSVLCIITLVAGFVLSGVNKITAPAIEKAEKAASENAMHMLLPEADTFTPSDSNENLQIATKDGSVAGFCAKVVTVGYGGDIVMMVGVDKEMFVQGIEILSQSETAGLGAKITDDSFKNQFKGKSLDGLKLVKTPTESPQEFTAVTGATISSRAIESGIAEAMAMVEKEIEEGTK